MGMLSVDLLVTLQILPGFFSNCLFFVLYDSIVLVKRVVSLLSCSGSPGEWQRMLTTAGVRSIWNSFLLDAYKQVSWQLSTGSVHCGVCITQVQRALGFICLCWDEVYVWLEFSVHVTVCLLKVCYYKWTQVVKWIFFFKCWWKCCTIRSIYILFNNYSCYFN